MRRWRYKQELCRTKSCPALLNYKKVEILLCKDVGDGVDGDNVKKAVGLIGPAPTQAPP